MYNVDFFKGYNGKVFIGLTPEEVIKNMPNYEKTLWDGVGDRREFSPEMLAFYDEENKICTAISIIDDEEDVYVNGIQFMRTAEKDLIPKLKKAFPFEEGFTNGEIYAYSEKAIGFFISEDMVKGVIVGKQGYFDDEKNETGPTRWRRF